MASVNKVILVGNLGRDPESRFMPSGELVANFSIATTESWKDKTSGEKKEQTEWHRISAFGKLAEIAMEYMKKGSQVYIEGSLRTRKWPDKDGRDQYSTEIRATSIQLLGSRAQAPSPSSQRQDTPAPRPQSQPQPSTGGMSDYDDDIPF